MDTITWRNDTRHLSDLLPWAHNPKRMSKKQADGLRISLEKFGFAVPFLISPDGEIYDGHQRQTLMNAMQEYGGDALVDVRVASRALTDDERRELVIRLKQNQAGWDFDMLANGWETEELIEWGFEEAELGLLPKANEMRDTVPQVDRAEELRQKWQTEPGQLWQLGELSIEVIPTTTVLAGAQATDEGNPGYSIGDQMLSGMALLIHRNLGVRLVYRLKDTRPLLRGEIAFWGGLLAALAPGDVDVVTHAPSSGKVPPGEHLATLLAQACAQELRKPFISAFVNEHQRGNRGSRTAKLQEARLNPYRYVGPGADALVLVVDDVVFTRSTARRCAAAALQGGDRVCFAVLYRA